MRAAPVLVVLLAATCTTQPALRAPVRSDNSSAAAALARADADMWAGRWSAAETSYRGLAAGGSFHARSHLALLLTYETRFVEAVSEARQAVQDQPDGDTYARLARALDWSNDVPGAIAAGAQAVAAAPTDPFALDFEAEALADAGRYLDAETLLSRAESRAANAAQRAEAAREWSNYYRDRGMSSDELNYVELALRYQPAFPWRTIELANEYLGAGPDRLADARGQLDSLLVGHPTEPEVLSAAAGSAFTAGDAADAQRYFHAALNTSPGDPTASLGLAEVLVSLEHDPSSARTVLVTALQRQPSSERVAGYLRELDSLVLHKDPASDVGSVTDAAAASERQSAYDAVNGRRVQVRLAPIAADRALADAAQEHAYYVLFNWGDSKLSGLGIHGEASTAPGFTGATSIDRDRHFGYAGYQSSEVINHTGTSAAAVEVWADSVYHRYPLLGRESTAFGYGEAQVGMVAVNVLDFGVGPPVTGPEVEYPYAGQTDVPSSFTGNEVPDPAPNAHYPLGYPITVEVGGADSLALSTATLTPLGGAALPLILDKPGQADLSPSELALLPEAPLLPETIYTIELRGQLDGRPWTARWSFKVGA